MKKFQAWDARGTKLKAMVVNSVCHSQRIFLYCNCSCLLYHFWDFFFFSVQDEILCVVSDIYRIHNLMFFSVWGIKNASLCETWVMWLGGEPIKFCVFLKFPLSECSVRKHLGELWWEFCQDSFQSDISNFLQEVPSCAADSQIVIYLSSWNV
jgi:hypothetical protein